MNIGTFIGIALLAAVITSTIRAIPVLLRELFDSGEEEDGTDR